MNKSYQPQISVITTVRNGRRTIERAIKSVLNQTYKNIQYIVIDGGSTDGTIEIIKAYAGGLSHWVSENDNGIYDGFNKGILTAKGDYVCILNADDYFLPDSIQKMVDAASRYATRDNPPIFHGNIDLATQSGEMVPNIRRPSDPFAKRYARMPVAHPATFVPRWVYQCVGTFDASYRIAGDYEFVLRAYQAGVEFFYLDETFVIMETGGASSLSNAYLLARERYKARCSHGGNQVAAACRLIQDNLVFFIRKQKRKLIPSRYEGS